MKNAENRSWCTFEKYGKLTYGLEWHGIDWNGLGHSIGGIWNAVPGALIQSWQFDSKHYAHSGQASPTILQKMNWRGLIIGGFTQTSRVPIFIARSKKTIWDDKILKVLKHQMAKQLIMSCKGIPETSSQPE